MSVASGYVHISVRNAGKPSQAAGLRQGFGTRQAFAPAAAGTSFPAPGYVPQGYNPNSYGQLRTVQPTEAAPLTAPTPVVAGNNAARPGANDNLARGFVLYMGIDEETAAAAGTSIAKLAQEIRAYAQSLVTGAESYAAVAMAPAGTPGSALDVVRSTFGDPTVNAQKRTETARLQQAAERGRLPEGLHAKRADGHTDHSAKESEKRRLIENHANDASARPADREEHANFVGSLKDGHEHRVHDTEHADEHGQQGSAPAHRADHAKSFAVTEVIGHRHGADLRDLRLDPLNEIAHLRLVRSRRDANVDRIDLVRRSENFLQESERQDNRTVFDQCAAFHDPDDLELRGLDLDWIADLFL